jgi:hypothetical protein
MKAAPNEEWRVGFIRCIPSVFSAGCAMLVASCET